MKEISIVMPAYNAEKFIAQAIESILNQTFKNFELIIIDDGSKDNTLEIITEYVRRDSRIRVISQENQGISNTLNRGIQEAESNWIAIMHADDVALPNRLEKQVNASKRNPEVVVWGSYAYHVNSQGKILSVSRTGPISPDEFCSLRKNGKDVIVIHPTAFLNKKVVQVVGGYNPQFDGSEDMELFDRMAEYGPVLAISEPLLLYRIHSTSISMNRFFIMRKFTRYIRRRHQTRLNGGLTPTFQEFLISYDNDPFLIRVRRKLDDLSQFYYRKAGLSFGEGENLKAMCLFGASAIINPYYAIPRLWNQLFSSGSRNALKEAPTKKSH